MSKSSNFKVKVKSLGTFKSLPAEVTSMAFHPQSKDILLTASEDHSLRLHSISNLQRPLSAIVGLPSEVASIVFADSSAQLVESEGWGNVWFACGQDIHLVNLDPTPFLRTFATAVVRSISLAGDDINDLTLSEDGNTLGWCGDEGRMGVVDLRTGIKTWMKGKHTSLAGSISFLPSRSDLVSTGYDTSTRLWSSTGSLLSTFWLHPPPPAPPSSDPSSEPEPPSLSMSPSFPQSFDAILHPLTSEPIICIGTADGMVWLSSSPSPGAPLRGGESEKDRKKRVKGRWRGLDEGGLKRWVVGMGPVEGVAFLSLPPTASSSSTKHDGNLRLLTVSHLGNLTLWIVSPSMELKEERKWSTSAVKKCSVLKVTQLVESSEVKSGGWRVVVGGLGVGAKGEAEGFDLVW